MTAIWPVGPPKLMKPSFIQKRKASPKVGGAWALILSPRSGVFPARVSLEVDDTFFSAFLSGEFIEIRHRIGFGPEAHFALRVRGIMDIDALLAIKNQTMWSPRATTVKGCHWPKVTFTSAPAICFRRPFPIL
jgi:hypothetical protein